MDNLIDDSNQNEEEARPRCVHCRRGLDLGSDVISIRAGVLGPRGFVQLEERKLLYNDSCLEDYVCNGKTEVHEMPRRIP